MAIRPRTRDCAGGTAPFDWSIIGFPAGKPSTSEIICVVSTLSDKSSIQCRPRIKNTCQQACLWPLGDGRLIKVISILMFFQDFGLFSMDLAIWRLDRLRMARTESKG